MTDEPNGSALRSSLRRLIDVGPDELAALAWATAASFLVLSSNYIIRPIRDVMGLEGGSQRLPDLWLGTLCVTIALSPVFSWLVTRFTRRRFLPWAYRGIGLSILGIGLAFYGWTSRRYACTVVFYTWSSAVNVLMVSVLWGTFADLFTGMQGKRLFGFIGVGGTIGAIAASALTTAAAQQIGLLPFLFVPVIALEAAIYCIKKLETSLPPRLDDAADAARRRPAAGAFDGFTATIRSRDLAGIAVTIILFTICSAFVYLEQQKAIEAAAATREKRQELSASVDLISNLIALPIHTLFAGRIMRLLGVGWTMALLPAVTLLGYAGYAAHSTLNMICGLTAVRKGIEYSLARPAREVLFTTMSRDARYKSKSFLDTFVYRSGDAIGAALSKSFAGLEDRTTRILEVIGACTVLWGGLVLWLAKRHERRERDAR